MISTKRYVGVNGSTTRFLSDFIIRSESHVRCYAYVYDAACSGGGTCDTLTVGGLYIREADAPQNNDLVSVNLWDLVDNSIVFYTAPEAGATLVIEVATTPEEFGDAIAQPIVIAAQASADAAAVSAAAALVSEINAATSETNAANSAASVNSANIIHTQGNGGGDPEGYTDTELNAGQLDTRYYTETELDAGQLDTRYYTETEADAAFASLTANQTISGDNDFTGALTSKDLTTGRSISVSSWSYVTTTITVNTAVAHGLIVGDVFNIIGLTSTTYAPNGTWTVASVVDTDTITFTAVNTPTGTAGVSGALLSNGDIEAKGRFVGKNACTAWVNFDGSTTPPTIRDSFNVSDVVRDATGIFQIVFSDAMLNINYSVVVSAGNFSTTTAVETNTTTGLRTVAQASVSIHNNSDNGLRNDSNVNVTILGGKE